MTNASLVSVAAVVLHLCSRLPLLAGAAVPLSLLITPPTSLFGRQLQAVQASSSSSSTSALTAMTTTHEDFEAYDGGDYKIFVGRGMERFRRGEVAGSVSDFDRAISLQPRLEAYLWQRGISLYYADQFEEGSRQFRKDVALNPNDTEEAIWTFMCESRIPSVGFATAKQRLVKISNERRPYMRAAYSLFKGDASESDLAKQMEVSAGSNGVADSGAPYFYANLYLGLYSEAKGDDVLARKYISAAVRSPYSKSGDYMCDVARVHQQARGW
ncbi:unnamed protein product [Ectocarpus sp. 12 AP-2014]